jgi:hypothetical protein
VTSETEAPPVAAESEESAPAARRPLITFHRLVPDARMPMRAERSAIGTLPTRAFRYCEAVVSAASFGYYVFFPMNFSVVWTGTEMMWTWPGQTSWYPLKSAQYPDFKPIFDAAAPEDVRDFSPPFISSLLEPGILQIWSGIIARTAPGYSLLVRPPANLPRSQFYDVYEGIIETDRWFGPLFTNLRLTKTDVPIEFSAEQPLVQVQPIPRELYSDAHLGNFELVPDINQLTPEDWDDYYDTVVRPNVQTHRQRGQYAIAARRRRSKDEG